MDYPVPGFRPLNQESSPRPLDQDLAQDLRRPLTAFKTNKDDDFGRNSLW